jgi:hypothetical protein
MAEAGEHDEHVRQVLTQAAEKLQRLVRQLEEDECDLAGSSIDAAVRDEGLKTIRAARAESERLLRQVQLDLQKHPPVSERKQEET